MESARDLLAGQPAEFAAAAGIALGLVALMLAFAITGLRKAEAAS
jgi:hypothetical protein